MTLQLYHRNAIMIPSMIIMGCFLLIGLADALFGEGYKSEWMTQGSGAIIGFAIVTANSLILIALSATIFLNRIELVKRSFFLSMLAWLLAPSIWLGYLIGKHISYLSHTQSGFDVESAFVFSNTIPYLIGLCWTFVVFRRHGTDGGSEHNIPPTMH